jgi:hypothetical protein
MIKTYDPAQIAMSIAGIPIEGIAEGTFVKVERNTETWKLKIGSGGEGARAKSNDKSGKFTFTLMQTSITNDALSALAKLDEESNNGIGAVLLKDLGGRTLCEAGTGWIQKPADVELSNEILGREWVVETDDVGMLIGGTDLTTAA